MQERGKGILAALLRDPRLRGGYTPPDILEGLEGGGKWSRVIIVDPLYFQEVPCLRRPLQNKKKERQWRRRAFPWEPKQPTTRQEIRDGRVRSVVYYQPRPVSSLARSIEDRWCGWKQVTVLRIDGAPGVLPGESCFFPGVIGEGIPGIPFEMWKRSVEQIQKILRALQKEIKNAGTIIGVNPKEKWVLRKEGEGSRGVLVLQPQHLGLSGGNQLGEKWVAGKAFERAMLYLWLREEMQELSGGIIVAPASATFLLPGKMAPEIPKCFPESGWGFGSQRHVLVVMEGVCLLPSGEREEEAVLVVRTTPRDLGLEGTLVVGPNLGVGEFKQAVSELLPQLRPAQGEGVEEMDLEDALRRAHRESMAGLKCATSIEPTPPSTVQSWLEVVAQGAGGEWPLGPDDYWEESADGGGPGEQTGQTLDSATWGEEQSGPVRKIICRVKPQVVAQMLGKITGIRVSPKDIEFAPVEIGEGGRDRAGSGRLQVSNMVDGDYFSYVEEIAARLGRGEGPVVQLGPVVRLQVNRRESRVLLGKAGEQPLVLLLDKFRKEFWGKQ